MNAERDTEIRRLLSFYSERLGKFVRKDPGQWLDAQTVEVGRAELMLMTGSTIRQGGRH